MVGLRRAAAGALSVLALAAAAADSGTLANESLDELSGLTVSRADPSVLWGHNDTGSGPVLYRIGRDGEDLGAHWLPEAHAGDWEDIAAFDDGAGPALLVADTGDNLGLRPVSTLYAVRDPGAADAPRLLWHLTFRYPDGPRDCEAMAVDGIRREILLVTKREQPPQVYRLPLPERAPTSVVSAELLGTLPNLPRTNWGERLEAPLRSTFFHAPTAFDIAADGRTAALITPRNAYIFRRRGTESWFDVMQRPPAAVVRMPDFDQIESGALAADGRTLYVGSENRPARFARLPLP